MPEVVMPRLSDTMEEGELSKWLKNEGDTVAKGDILAEIETDKATMDLEAFESGVLEKQLVEAGSVVPIGTPVAIIGDGSGKAQGAPTSKAPKKDEAESPEDAGRPEAATDDTAAAKTPERKPEESEPAEDEPAEGKPAEHEPAEGESVEHESEQRPAPESSESDPQATSPDAKSESAAPDRSARPRMSPLARKIAKDHGLDPSDIAGSGPQGRVVRADVEAAISEGTAHEASASSRGTASGRAGTERTGNALAGKDEVVAVNRIRKVAAKRLTESQAVPHFFLTSVVDVERLLDFRAEVNAALESRGAKVSVNDLVVRAAAVTLRRHPEANSSWGDDALIRKAHVNVGIAVATDAGLLVPVIRDADRKDLESIARESLELAAKAREGKLSPDEMSGGTFSVSNLGMFGIDQFTAVINPPEAAILAVGAATPVPVVRDGALATVPKLKITLTVDHRVMDGAVAAGFLRDLVGVLEHPLGMVV